MTLHDIENTLPPYIRFAYDMGDRAGVIVYDTYMGMIYNTNEGLYYLSPYDKDYSDNSFKKDIFLTHFNYELLLSTRYFEPNNCYQLYKLEPRFRVVYK